MYYFAYGSNTNFDHMRRVCGWHFTALGMATLADYEFGPDRRGFATVRPQIGQHVLGVLYEIDQYCVNALDEFEGYPDIFNRIEVVVTDIDNQSHTAYIYIEPVEQFGGDYLRESYIKMIVAGAIQNHLPKEWIKFLESFRHQI